MLGIGTASNLITNLVFVCLFAPNKLNAMTSDGRVVSRCFAKAALKGEQGLFGGNSSCPTYTSIYQERTLTSNALEGTSKLSTGRLMFCHCQIWKILLGPTSRCTGSQKQKSRTAINGTYLWRFRFIIPYGVFINGCFLVPAKGGR